MLSKLENCERPKELVNVEQYTIEHIMPQNSKLSKHWQTELGESWKEVQAKYLHTIGNLTLTGYNSEYSDRPFPEKRDMKDGFADSPLRLNQMLSKLEYWNETEIQNRAEALADKAIKIWSFPLLDLEITKMPFSDAYSNNCLEDISGEIKDLLEPIRKRILNLDASVREEVKKKYIAYKTTRNFVGIVIRKSRLVLTLNMGFEEIKDPKRLCRDISKVGHWAPGDVEVSFSSLDQIDYVMFLVQQAFNKYSLGVAD